MRKARHNISVNKIDEPLKNLECFHNEMNKFYNKITHWACIGKDSAEDENVLHEELRDILSKYLTLNYYEYTQQELIPQNGFDNDFTKVNVSWFKSDGVKTIIEITELNHKFKYTLYKETDSWRIDLREVFDEIKKYWKSW